MAYDQSQNTMTQAELDKAIRQHELWLKSNGKQGKAANFYNQILVGLNFREVNLWKAHFCKTELQDANFMRSNLHEANFQEADLRGADFWKANLFRADFSRADLRTANFQEANLKEAFFRNANFYIEDIKKSNTWKLITGTRISGSNSSSTLKQKLSKQQYKLKNLTDQLVEAQFDFDKKEISRLKTEISQMRQKEAATQTELNQLKEITSQYEEEIQAKNKILEGQITEAQTALSEIFLNSADKRIKSHGRWAWWCGCVGVGLIVADVSLIGGFIGKYWFGWFGGAGGNKALDWSFAVYSFPVIVMMMLAATLLRHQKKLLDEVRHFSSAKHQIELFSGLLRASQHAAAHLNDPEQSARYVQETFGKIRDKLLQYNFAAPADKQDGDTGGAMEKLAEKVAEKIVSGGKDV